MSTYRDEPVLLNKVNVPVPCEAFLVPVSGFPMQDWEARRYRVLISRLTEMASRRWDLSVEVFVQFAQLSLGDAAARFSSHVREWVPTLGLGIWPDRTPPSLWTQDEFMDLGMSETPRKVSYKVLRVTTQKGRDEAPEAMLGLGTIVQIMVPRARNVFLTNTRIVFLPTIKEPMFRKSAFYLPLIDRGTLEKAVDNDLLTWLCGGAVYIRESTEDSALLILSREPLAPVLHELGGKFVSESAAWTVPV
jgi:hypothetical protein